MAKSKTNKSQYVRDYYTDNPQATVKEVMAALSAKGMDVTSALIYKVKGAMAERKHRKQRVAKAAMAATRENAITTKADAITMIREVKALAAKAGGYEKLKELVEALAE